MKNFLLILLALYSLTVTFLYTYRHNIEFDPAQVDLPVFPEERLHELSGFLVSQECFMKSKWKCYVMNPKYPWKVNRLVGFGSDELPRDLAIDESKLSPDKKFQLSTIHVNNHNLGDDNQGYGDVITDLKTNQKYLLNTIPHYNRWWRWVPSITFYPLEEEGS